MFQCQRCWRFHQVAQALRTGDQGLDRGAIRLLIDEAMLGRYLDRLDGPAQYMTCGPEPVMDLVESVLRSRGVDWRRIFAERFEIV
jgi:ferredoxin-NADP reductase